MLQVKEQIAEGVGAYSVSSDEAASRLMYAHYTYDSAADTSYAVINAADFTGLDTTDDVTSSDPDYTVVGIAAIAGISEGALGNTIGGYNLHELKPDGMG